MRCALSVFLVVLLACGEKPVADGGVPQTDAGDATQLDAGTPPADSGVTPVDAGSFDAGPKDAGAPGDFTYAMPGYPDREYDVHVPSTYTGTPLPVVLVLHGGGGDKTIARKTTCPNGNLSSLKCLDAVADSKGFIVVYPEGTGGPLLADRKTWNAGGGDGGWQCVSGYACNSGVAEKPYFTALLLHLATKVHFDRARVFATGHSNGAAMSEALACLMPSIAGIAPVAGGNQYSTTQPCTAPTPVLEIHGTADPCWLFDGGDQSCADPGDGAKISVAATLAGWRARNGCNDTEVTRVLPDLTNDGTTTTVHTFDCPAKREVILYEVVGGGHTWPSGSAQGSMTGPISTDFSANEVMLDFFAAH